MADCILCGKDFNDDDLFEGTICWECKLKQDELDFGEEREAFESDMLCYNHKGTWCWLTGKTFCQQGWCDECNLYQGWKEELRCQTARAAGRD